jgi:hypothetical protein
MPLAKPEYINPQMESLLDLSPIRTVYAHGIQKNDSSFLSVLEPLRENPDRESAPVTPTLEEPEERLPKMQNR